MDKIKQPRKCTHCGAPLTADAPEGLCPRCLVALNLASQTELPGDVGPNGTKKVPAPPKSPPPPQAIAGQFPQFEILECLGRGGMGVVYKARQKSLDRLVALKILAPEREKDPQFAERFVREAKTLAQLSHPNIVTVHDFGEAEGMFYLVMEFVDGVNLRQLLKEQKLSPEEALAIVPPVCEALQYAHRQGVIHRDIKPENLLLDKQGRVKIADFGIAKILGRTPQGKSLTRRSGALSPAGGEEASVTRPQVIGTPPYMAPEQTAAPQKVDHRADIYSLGVVLYEMLTGELPAANLQPPSKKVQVDVHIDEIVLRALEKEPERRYQTAEQFKTMVETIVQTPPPKPQDTVPPTLTETTPRFPRTAVSRDANTVGRWRSKVLTGAVVIVLALGALLFWVQRPRPWDRQTVSAVSSDGMYKASGGTWLAARVFGTDRRFYEFTVQGHGGSVFKHWEVPVPAEAAATNGTGSMDDISFARHGRIAWSDDNKQVSFQVNGIEVSRFDTAIGRPITNASFNAVKGLALEAIRKRAIWPATPVEVCKAFWNARGRKNFAEMELLWPGSAAWNWSQICARDTDAKYVFGEPAAGGTLVPYATEDHFKATGTYNRAMGLRSLNTRRGPRYYIITASARFQKRAVQVGGPRVAAPAGFAVADLPPVVVNTLPESGADNVDPGLKEISVTFSKDMMTNRMWAICRISEETFPKRNGPIHYINRRTCVMPVKLEPGETYVLWFNRGQSDWFRDTANHPSVPYQLAFRTTQQPSQERP